MLNPLRIWKKENYDERDIILEGWYDAQCWFDNDSEGLARALLDKNIEYNKIVELVVEYNNGFEIGHDMNLYAEEMYDEDGCSKNELDFFGSYDYSSAKRLVKNICTKQ